jgi:hypothetical protein
LGYQMKNESADLNTIFLTLWWNNIFTHSWKFGRRYI